MINKIKKLKPTNFFEYLVLGWVFVVILLIAMFVCKNNDSFAVDIVTPTPTVSIVGTTTQILTANNMTLSEALIRIQQLTQENQRLQQQHIQDVVDINDLSTALENTNTLLEEAEGTIDSITKDSQNLIEELDRQKDLLDRLFDLLNTTEDQVLENQSTIGLGALTDFYSAKLFMTYRLFYGFNIMFGGGYIYDTNFYYSSAETMPEWFKRTHLMIGAFYQF